METALILSILAMIIVQTISLLSIIMIDNKKDKNKQVIECRGCREFINIKRLQNNDLN